jgi:hypothetical protein
MRAWSEGLGSEHVCPNCGFTAQQQRDTEQRQSRIAALLEERRGARDKAHATQIDKQLAYYGHKPAKV